MPTIDLSGRTAPGLTCPPGRAEQIYWSHDLPGFGLRCRASGARSWLLQVRTKAGETRKITLGDPGTVPFARAAREAGKLIAAVKLGGDPGAEARQARRAIKISELVEHYLTHQRARMKPRSFLELSRHLKAHAKPLHGQPAGAVTRSSIVALLQNIGSTAPVTANRVRASLSAMFAWGMKAGLVTANPVAATFKPADERPRERVLSDAELALIWSCTTGDADYDRIVRLLMLTGARREEIAGMTCGEVTAHADGTATWVLPSARSKNHLANELVLPRMAVALLPAVRIVGGERRDLLFGEGEGPYSGWSRAKERLDARLAAANGGAAIPAWVLHDLRRTFVTRLNDMAVEPHVIEALVNHTSGAAKAGVAGVYNRSVYAPQKRAALIRWGEHLAALVGVETDPAPSAEIVPLRRSA